jgi:hypothetical protein
MISPTSSVVGLATVDSVEIIESVAEEVPATITGLPTLFV